MLLGAGMPLGRTLFWPQSTWRKHWAESSHSALRPARFFPRRSDTADLRRVHVLLS
jgi:hypothetical protein